MNFNSNSVERREKLITCQYFTRYVHKKNSQGNKSVKITRNHVDLTKDAGSSGDASHTDEKDRLACYRKKTSR